MVHIFNEFPVDVRTADFLTVFIKTSKVLPLLGVLNKALKKFKLKKMLSLKHLMLNENTAQINIYDSPLFLCLQK